MTASIYNGSWRLRKERQSFFIRLMQIIGGSLFLALCAQIKIPLFFTPVPITMHTFAIMLLGACLGKRDGALAVLAYLFELSIGLPFGHSGVSKPLALIGPTGGYLMAFVAQAYCVGWVVEQRWTFSVMKTTTLFCAITTFQLLWGTAWLAQFVGTENAMLAGIYPFLIGDYLKCFAVACILYGR